MVEANAIIKLYQINKGVLSMKLFKKLTSLLLCPILALCTCACATAGQGDTTTTADSQPQESIDPNAPLCDGKTLKLLAITSSFGQNTTDLLYDVAVAEGCTDVVVGRLYASGCTLAQHVTNAETNAAAYTYSKNSTGSWEVVQAASMMYGLQDEDWDIIFIQQSAAQAGLEESYLDYLDILLPYVNKNKSNPNARLVWNMTWAYQADSEQNVFVTRFKKDQKLMYETLVNVLKDKILPRTEFSAIIPTGTAVQNARTSFIGDTLTKDTFHLNNLGKVIAGYTLYSTLTGKEVTKINLDTVSSYDISTPIMVTEQQKEAIVEAVNNAIKNPYEVTPSTYTG